MKTARQIAYKYAPPFGNGPIALEINSNLKSEIEQYGREVAQDALNLAAENAEVEFETNNDYPFGKIIEGAIVDRQSILNTEIILP
ncbi:hypothetical protein [Dyadobacter sp. CY312]|uniref:hypothetical protein n=1 Tax=Dyadobacter sp. CY312 TaxID=2907303 RepID=UPI001F15D52D|nr:hypothetical protein [Dyadobacter sp. CY312]MCE7039216.1 hypothetical protein [Dyadobacter sp. CY312]